MGKDNKEQYWERHQYNMEKKRPPNKNDDETTYPTKMYKCEFWFDDTTSKLYMCVDSSKGNAVWKEFVLKDMEK